MRNRLSGSVLGITTALLMVVVMTPVGALRPVSAEGSVIPARVEVAAAAPISPPRAIQIHPFEEQTERILGRGQIERLEVAAVEFRLSDQVPATWDGGAARWGDVVDVVNALPAPYRRSAQWVTWRYGCFGEGRCRMGAYDISGMLGGGPRALWLGESAWAQLGATVTHELAHAWFRTGMTEAHRVAVLASVRGETVDVLAGLGDIAQRARTGGFDAEIGDEERWADCVARILGASWTHYWSCPQPARSHVAVLLDQLGVTG